MTFVARLTCLVLCMVAMPSRPAPAASSAVVQYFFINGVSLSAYRDRYKSARLLESRLQTAGAPSSSLSIIPLPNPSQGIWSDIFQKLVVQKEIEAGVGFKAAVRAIAQLTDGDPTYAPSAQDSANLGNAETELTAAAQQAEYQQVIAPEETQMLRAVTTALQQGDPVVIVAHSEGNMFANALATRVQALAGLAIAASGLPVSGWAANVQVVNIATPTASAPSGLYGTARQDDVITLLAHALAWFTGTLPPLQANWDFTGAHAYDLLGHGFVSVYLNPALDTQNQLPGLVVQANALLRAAGPVQLLQSNCRPSPGWRCAVLQPDGSLVYPSGRYGISASDLQMGTYAFGVEALAGTEACQLTPGFGAASLSVAALTMDSSLPEVLQFSMGGVVPASCAPGAFSPGVSVVVAPGTNGAPFSFSGHYD